LEEHGQNLETAKVKLEIRNLELKVFSNVPFYSIFRPRYPQRGFAIAGNTLYGSNNRRN